MTIEVVPWTPLWAEHFDRVAADLRSALAGVEIVGIEHVGSTSVPGLAAKPVLDIDVVVEREHLPSAISALVAAGYVHRGDLGMTDRESFRATDHIPRRHVYACVDGTLHLRNHLAVRDVLRRRADLRDRYAEVKRQLTSDPTIDMDAYIAGKSVVLQEVLALSDLTDAERAEILRVNAGG